MAPDQRAVVALVLQQGRSYDDIATLLGIPFDAVRARARAGLAALVGDSGLPGEVTAPLADYLLGQQSESDAEATRGLLAESAPARGWAEEVAAKLAGAAPNGLPEIPGGAAAAEPEPEPEADPEPPAPAPETAAPAPDTPAPAPAGPRPRPLREPAGDDAPPPASRLGGVLLIAGVLAVVAVVLFLVLRGGDDPGDEQAASSPTPAATPTPTAAPAQVADTIDLRPASGGKAKGTMTVFLQGGRLQFQLVAQDVPPSRGNAAYAVWFTGPGDKVHRLGFTNPVGADGNLGIQGPGESDAEAFPKLYATYANVVVSRESTEDAKRPSKVVLRGKLPKGR
jgi:hypothetical protein